MSTPIPPPCKHGNVGCCGFCEADKRPKCKHGRPLALNTDDYRMAPWGNGPKAFTREDKPHRLVYDLCEEVERVRAGNAALREELAAAKTGRQP